MNIKFQKLDGRPELGIEFSWMLEVRAGEPEPVRDYFIPELHYDYFWIQQGSIRCQDERTSLKMDLPQAFLKTLFTHPLKLEYAPSLVLYGARLSLRFAEFFWEPEIPANTILTQPWLEDGPNDLNDFSSRLAAFIRRKRERKNPYDMLAVGLEETNWLAAYSARQKRRLYRSTFGLSRKEMLRIQSIHTFLDQTCDFGAQNPRIIDYITPEVFYDQPHLNRAFKQMTGMSPREYFGASAILQDNLMAASYNANPTVADRI